MLTIKVYNIVVIYFENNYYYYTILLNFLLIIQLYISYFAVGFKLAGCNAIIFLILCILIVPCYFKNCLLGSLIGSHEWNEAMSYVDYYWLRFDWANIHFLQFCINITYMVFCLAIGSV